mgnify:CR=1 FL=1
MEEARTRLQKIVLLALAVMAVVFGILMFVSKSHPGVLLDGALLQPAEVGDTVTYEGKLHGEQLSLSVQRESDTVTVVTCETESGSDVYRMEYPLEPIRAVDGFARGEMVDGIRITKNGDVLFEGGYTRENGEFWYDADGRWDQDVYLSAYLGSDVGIRALELEKQDVMWLANDPELTTRGNWLYYFAMLLFSLMVALDAAFPLALFYWRHMCDVRDPEPSDFYLTMQRIGWVVYPILIFIGYIWALRYLP